MKSMTRLMLSLTLLLLISESFACSMVLPEPSQKIAIKCQAGECREGFLVEFDGGGSERFSLRDGAGCDLGGGENEIDPKSFDSVFMLNRTPVFMENVSKESGFYFVTCKKGVTLVNLNDVVNAKCSIDYNAKFSSATRIEWLRPGMINRVFRSSREAGLFWDRTLAWLRVRYLRMKIKYGIGDDPWKRGIRKN